MVTNEQRITRRETRLAEILAGKATLTAAGLSSTDSTSRDYQLLVREETQVRAELAELRTR